MASVGHKDLYWKGVLNMCTKHVTNSTSVVLHIGRLTQTMAQNLPTDSWEYDAPSHVVDFKELDLADAADHWFGESTLLTYLTLVVFKQPLVR